MQRLSTRGLTLLLGPLILLGSAHAEMYKWTDAEGNIHYSQSIPPGVEATTMKAPPPPPTPVQKKQSKEEEQEIKDQPIVTKRDEVVKKNCEAARKNLNIYTNYRRIMNEKGEVEVLDEEVRKAKIAETQKQIKEYCK